MRDNIVLNGGDENLTNSDKNKQNLKEKIEFKIRNFINDYDGITESLDYTYPSHIKNRIRSRYKGNKSLPNILNCNSNFINIINNRRQSVASFERPESVENNISDIVIRN